jgi:hypothetical protein
MPLGGHKSLFSVTLVRTSILMILWVHNSMVYSIVIVTVAAVAGGVTPCRGFRRV